MNIIFLIIILLTTVIIFGLPIWNIARTFGSKNVLWLIAPPLFFIGLFGLAGVFESYEMILTYKILKTLSFYWLITGMIFFGFSLFGFLLEKAFTIPPKKIFWGILSLTFMFVTISSINGQGIVVKEVNLNADYITRPYTFVHISDLHAGSTDLKHAQKVVDNIKPLNPEFIVITGDFIDEFFVSPKDIAPFNELDFPIYLITGNHEYYLPSNKIQEVIKESDINLIDDQRVVFEELDIIGVNELMSVDATLDALGGIHDDRYTIILDHQPISEEAEIASQQGARLMLSGHTHKGQIWPMGWLVSLRYKYVAGLYQIGEMFLYVNQGTGTLGPKMRLGTANEITLISLNPKQ